MRLALRRRVAAALVAGRRLRDVAAAGRAAGAGRQRAPHEGRPPDAHRVLRLPRGRARRVHESVRTVPNVSASRTPSAATDGAIRAALLLDAAAARARDAPRHGDTLRRRPIGAQGRIARRPSPITFSTVDSLPRQDARFAAAAGADGLRRMQELRASFPALVEERRAGAGADPLSAYAWLAFYCTHSANRGDRSAATLLGPVAPLRDAPYRPGPVRRPAPVLNPRR